MLINDAFSFLKSGHLGVETVLDLIQYVKGMLNFRCSKNVVHILDKLSSPRAFRENYKVI